MLYKRDEAFRYIFNTPLQGKFKIISINDKHVDSHEGDLRIIDLSLEGMKIETKFNLPTNVQVMMMITFSIIDEMEILGKIVWKESLQENTVFHYGIKIHTNDEEKKSLIEDLKTFAKKSI